MVARRFDYTPVAKFLHWTVAGMVVLQFVLANLAEDAESKLRQLALLANHKSVGITILALVVLRLAWRLANRPPALPGSVPAWQVVASRISHWSLYGLLVFMPITGWLMSSASAYSVSWFNLFQLPDFVAPDPGLKDIFEEIHEALAKILFVIAAVHVLAALKHAVIDRDRVLQRMSSLPSIATFIAIIVAGAIVLGGAGRAGAAPAAGMDDDETNMSGCETVECGPPRWDIDYGSSHIRFTGKQAGATFDGVWQAWRADIRFSPSDLAASAFDVTIDTAAVETYDDDRNATLADPEWFDPDKFPVARFIADDFTPRGDGRFIANARLVIKDRPNPVRFEFRVVSDGNRRLLEGRATLDRLALGVGTGEWIDTTWVGREVRVDVRVSAAVPERASGAPTQPSQNEK